MTKLELYMKLNYITMGGITLVESLTAPTISLHFMQLLDKQSIATVITFQGLLMAGFQTLMSKESVRNKLRNYLFHIVVFELILCTVANLVMTEMPSIRLYILTFASIIGSVFIYTLFMDIINSKVSGTALTTYQSKLKSVMMWCAALGGLCAIFYTQLDLMTALYIKTGMAGIDVLISKKQISLSREW